ncbi:MAG: hypothetical protein LUH21_03800, partial [Clostridiales bacterium]|nr:hypothetical protein [Clostridiales bacterium]
MPKSIIKPRSATKAEWEAANPILKKQEIGYEVPAAGIGKGKIKMKQGDGVTAWKSLAYASDDVNADDLLLSSITTSTASYPVPAVNDTLKVGFGKIKKFFEDIRNATTGACFIGQIVNNCVTDNAKLPLSAAQGKELMDLYTVLNRNL